MQKPFEMLLASGIIDGSAHGSADGHRVALDRKQEIFAVPGLFSDHWCLNDESLYCLLDIKNCGR